MVFSAAESLGTHCKSQPDILLSNYECYRGWLRVAAEVGTSCQQWLTTDFLAITAKIENALMHIDTNT